MTAAVDRNVFHRQRPCLALLHCAFLPEGLRELHPWRRLAGDPARHLERRGLPAFPPRASVRHTSKGVLKLRPPMEPLVSCRSTRRSDRSTGQLCPPLSPASTRRRQLAPAWRPWSLSA